MTNVDDVFGSPAEPAEKKTERYVDPLRDEIDYYLEKLPDENHVRVDARFIAAAIIAGTLAIENAIADLAEAIREGHE